VCVCVCGVLGVNIVLSLGRLVVTVLASIPDSHGSYWLGDYLWAGKPPVYFSELPRPTQPPILSGRYQPKCGDALRLGSKGRMVHFMRG